MEGSSYARERWGVAKPPPFHIPYRTPTPSLITWCGGTVGGKGGPGGDRGRKPFSPYRSAVGGKGPPKRGPPPFKLRLRGGGFRTSPPPSLSWREREGEGGALGE